MTKLDEVREQLGDWPIVVAKNFTQFKVVCRTLGLNPQRTTSALNHRSLEGTRPTHVVYAPGWQDDPDWQKTSEMLDRLMIFRNVRPGVTYLSDSDLQ